MQNHRFFRSFPMSLRPAFAALVLVFVASAGGATQTTGVSQAQAYWQCVPIARMLSGIEIRGDAHTWWGQANGRYERGRAPKRGAVLAFKPYGAMRLGHVAAVSKVIDDRTILVTHSNWSTINGRRGQIERNVRVVDASDNNDWSRVKVWYAPLGDIGTTVWPVHGFIYPVGRAPMALPGGVVPASRPSVAVPDQIVATEPEIKPTGRLAYLGKVLKRL
jgi:surface antigen